MSDAVAVRLTGEPPGPGEWAVPSRTFPGECRVVVWRADDLRYCGCPGFHRRRTCRHAEAVALAVEVEARRLTTTSTPEARARAAARLHEIEELFGA